MDVISGEEEIFVDLDSMGVAVDKAGDGVGLVGGDWVDCIELDCGGLDWGGLDKGGVVRGSWFDWGGLNEGGMVGGGLQLINRRRDFPFHNL